MRDLRRLDLSAYLRAFPLLVRNPELLVAPLLMAVVGIAVGMLLPSSGGALGGITGGLTQFFLFLLDAFGLAVSVILADGAWRRGRGSFEDAWSDARRKAGDILLAAIGLNFVLFVAIYAGSLLGGSLQLILAAIAFFFLIYTIPAAAIGGIPGAAALQVSIDRVRRDPLRAAILTVVFVAVYWYVGVAAAPLLYSADGLIASLIGALLKALALAYLSLVLAKNYADGAFGRYY